MSKEITNYKKLFTKVLQTIGDTHQLPAKLRGKLPTKDEIKQLLIKYNKMEKGNDE